LQQKVNSQFQHITKNYNKQTISAHHLSNPIQYEHAPLRVRCAMLRKHHLEGK